MKSAVLEFNLLDDLFCFNTKDVDYVFELENYNQIGGFHESVIGITNYNADVMLLVDTAKLYSDKFLDLTQEKSVVVIHDDHGMKYGMLVDEIIKIEELEVVNPTVDLNTEELVVNHYKDKANNDEIVNEIYPLPLLKKYDIPSMASNARESFIEGALHKDAKSSSFLLFKVADKMYGVSSAYVKEVLENDAKLFEMECASQDFKGAIAIRDEIIKMIALDKSSVVSDILVLECCSGEIALEVDEVYDIEYFQTANIENLTGNGKIKAFYNFNQEVVAILDPEYFFSKEKANEEKSEVNQEEQGVKKEEYLIFKLSSKKYSIPMACIRQVIETESLAKTQSSSIINHEAIEFLATWNSHAVAVFSMAKLIGLQEELQEDSQTIFIENDGHHVAIIVDEIDDIVYLSEENINRVQVQKEAVVGGAVVYNDEVIVRINEHFLSALG
jgi:chemotaxis signal transduction protein